MKDRVLTVSEEEKDLGIIIDSKLTFEKHMQAKINKAQNDSELVILFYTALIDSWGDLKRPLIEVKKAQHDPFCWIPSNQPLEEKLVKIESFCFAPPLDSAGPKIGLCFR